MKRLLVLGAILSCAWAQAAVIANIGEKALTEEDLKKDFMNIGADQKEAINKDFQAKKSLVDNAINMEVLVSAAKKSGLEQDEDYKKALERFQRQYLSSKFMQKAVEPRLTNKEVRKFFDDNRGFFDTSEVCAVHIVMKDEAEAKKVLEMAHAKNAKFEDLALKHSIDPSVTSNKGNLGCFTKEKMVPEFGAAAFNMRKGEIKGVVKTMYGYHIIKVLDVKPGKVPGFDEIEAKVKETYRLKMVTDVLNDLRNKSHVKINDEALRKFKL